MCLVVWALAAHPQYRLIVAANRDEFYARPTEVSKWWADHNNLLAGRDLQGGGTWMGVTRGGRFAVITNFREPSSEKKRATTRGRLVEQFLRSEEAPDKYVQAVVSQGESYNGFNLIVADPSRMAYVTNTQPGWSWVEPGIYGLSNHRLDTPWPKVARAKKRFSEILRSNEPDTDAIMDMMSDRETAPDKDMPVTGVGIEWERKLSPVFIQMPHYGTRTTTIFMEDHTGRCTWIERTWDPVLERFTLHRYAWHRMNL